MATGPGIEGHYSLSYDVELENLRTKALEMGWLVEQQLEDSVEALANNNSKLAKQVRLREDLVNRMEVENDELCLQLIARRQPAASDLRFVISVIKTVNDLERMGDEIDRVARVAMKLAESTSETDIEDLEVLGMHSLQFTREALVAFAQSNVEKAMEVMIEHEQVEKDYRSVLRRTEKNMRRDIDGIPNAIEIIWATRSLERVADRACNICEYVIYFARGKDIRHSSLKQIKKVAREEDVGNEDN